MEKRFRSIDICTGGGGLALGLEQAGFDPVLVLDNLPEACETLRTNRPGWDVREMDLRHFDPVDDQHVYDVDLLSAGLPRVKATAAANRGRGDDDEVDLLNVTSLLAHGVRPRAVLVENLPDLVTQERYAEARKEFEAELEHLKYTVRWLVLNAADYGVPQHRKQGVMVAFREGANAFEVPQAQSPPRTVGAVLLKSMASQGWSQAAEWAAQADRPAPTIVGGSGDHGGPDLGPTGSKKKWAAMGVNGLSFANELPPPDFHWDPSLGTAGMVRLTVEQAALLQGFPEDWRFAGRKTKRYRQVGNAFPPPVARALGLAIRRVLEKH